MQMNRKFLLNYLISSDKKFSNQFSGHYFD